ncbi:unnamed protein product [Didymodactylos carnosus]|uniref:Uncharacterized protein n=1 Tax=Didymodactylos carnosus TaxID=1234261 RepID=A0A815CB49_9BILA|nr:unnamed protein product [Didymodactylos carnosus]CAF1281235.1 unnamed protein product [Didymodactylos carnosus]CAF3944461.1 unnamed protein product [Didymodactylos carnosus]CAF4076738.1 unnamed protein product [Didymodactylos carnosus]
MQLYPHSRKTKDDKIVLIISDEFTEMLLSTVHDLKQLFAVYVYSLTRETNQAWQMKYKKKIFQDQFRRDQIENAQTSLSITERTHKNLSYDVGNSIWFQLFIDVLLRMNIGEERSERLEFVEFCKQQYVGNEIQLKKIDKFEQTYDPSQALEYYIKEPFVYRILNKALR